MSLLSTTPQLNPTVIENNPTQVLYSTPVETLQILNPGGQLIMKQHNAMHVENMTFEKVAEVEKFLAKIDWTVGDVGEFLKYEFTIEQLDNIITEMPQSFYWRDFGEVEFRLKTTLNAFVAGLAVLYYDPAPSDDYWSVMFDVSITNQHRVLFQNILFEPVKASQIAWTLPFSNPFRLYPNKVSGGDYNVTYTADYIRRYSMGRIIAYPIVPLVTGTDITRVPFALRAKMKGLRVGGANFANTT